MPFSLILTAHSIMRKILAVAWLLLPGAGVIKLVYDHFGKPITGSMLWVQRGMIVIGAIAFIALTVETILYLHYLDRASRTKMHPVMLRWRYLAGYFNIGFPVSLIRYVSEYAYAIGPAVRKAARIGMIDKRNTEGAKRLLEADLLEFVQASLELALEAREREQANRAARREANRQTWLQRKQENRLAKMREQSERFKPKANTSVVLDMPVRSRKARMLEYASRPKATEPSPVRQSQNVATSKEVAILAPVQEVATETDELPTRFAWARDEGGVEYMPRFYVDCDNLTHGLYAQLKKQLRLLAQNQWHPSLKTRKFLHEVPGAPSHCMVSRVTREYRFAWQKDGGVLTVYSVFPRNWKRAGYNEK